MTDQYVRVQHADTGHQYTVGKAKAANDPKLKIVDKPSTNLSGHPLPPKFRTTLPSANTGAGSKTDPKESK